MTRPRRTLGALLAAGVLLLGGCAVDSDSEPGTDSGATEQSQSAQQEAGDPGWESEGAGGAPGDLLPSAPESPEATQPLDSTEPSEETTDPETATQPADDGGAEPELGGPGIPACDLLDLPATALDTIEDIEAGGPYEFPRNDGVTFQNREGILPDESHDYYREFTVVTPNLDHRGARRIVTGGGAETDPDRWYFTGDHYESFCEFDPDRH